MSRYSLTRRTTNRKVSNLDPSDPVATVTISADTCPDTCPLKGAGCYGEGGPQKIHWDKVTAHARGTNLDGLLASLASLPARAKVRYAVTGDQPGEGDKINRHDALRLARTLSRLHAWTYTHKPPEGENLTTIRQLNEHYAVNLSADTLTEADEFKALGIAPVTVVLPFSAATLPGGEVNTPAGHRVKVCPATLPGSDVTCNTCMLCAVPSPARVIVGFPAHGFRTRRIDERLTQRKA